MNSRLLLILLGIVIGACLTIPLYADFGNFNMGNGANLKAVRIGNACVYVVDIFGGPRGVAALPIAQVGGTCP